MPGVDAAFNLVINGRFLSQQMTGVQRVAREFVWALDRLMAAGAYPGLRVRLIAQHDADLDGEELAAIDIERIAGGRGHHWEQFTLPRHIGDAALLCLGNTAPIRSLRGDRPVAVMLHDLAYRLFGQDYSVRYRAMHRVIDHVALQHARPLITVSDAERSTIATFDPAAARRILVAPNGGFARDMPPDLLWSPATGDDAYAMHVGALSQRKNVAGLVAVAIDLARRKRLHFRFVGPPNACSGAAARSIPADVRPLITFRGYIDDDELYRLYAGARLLLFPSLYEASGLPPIEAMAIGCPVIVSDLPVMRERCGGAALYCDPHDHAAMAQRAIDLLEQPALARRLSVLGRIHATRFTWARQVEQVVAAIAAEMHGPG